eukprot:CAMPEP_0202897154 /NCGR_PEP_ID=MMETSP1392-20130828/5993_1 /ASSEMBLY_ACC=CAM_ASM_000868 /TAXON_ID=225041 /ORGANISM="Chlamydomonas chlamydogama, Strain SAG 11-48b" /LENGTH=366 /DNA_ID=CAMNT_0049582727 /DNA_START=253 /DNA_END=1353 /DNA_ORIENTATION=-
MASNVSASSASASTKASKPEPALDRESIRKNVDRAAQMLDEMLEEVMRDMFVEEAAAYISNAQAGLTEEEAVRRAVVQRLEYMDANFLAALNGYIKAVSAAGSDAAPLTALLLAIREEVMRQVTLRLPPAARALHLLAQEVDKDRRLAVMRAALSGGSGELPASTPDALVSSSTTFIDDMEEQTVVADRRLLARLCLVREEARWLELEAAFNAPSASSASQPGPETTSDDGSAAASGPGSSRPISAAMFVRSNVPQRCAAFIKELVGVADSAARVGLLSRTFSEDWEGAAPRQKPQSADRREQPDWVRPGRFMATLHALTAQLEVDGGEANAAVLKRMRDIHLEAMSVLDKIQRGDIKVPSPGSAK